MCACVSVYLSVCLSEHIILAVLASKSITRMKNIFKMNKEVRMLLQKRANTSGAGMSNM